MQAHPELSHKSLQINVISKTERFTLTFKTHQLSQNKS